MTKVTLSALIALAIAIPALAQTPPETTTPAMPSMNQGTTSSTNQGTMPCMQQGTMPCMQRGTTPGMQQGMMPGMQQGAMPGMQQGAMPASANHMEMMQKMEAMNKAMMGTPMTGNPDQDLVNMMMPHHQGAIDMARIYLRDGKDPEIRRMAQKIIKDQEKEITQFKAWQAKHPVTARP